MRRLAIFLFLSLLLSVSVAIYGQSQEDKWDFDDSDFAESELLSEEEFPVDEEYLQGYLQALIDCHYDDFRVRVQVRGGCIYLSHMPHNRPLARSIVQFVKDFPGVEEVVVEETESTYDCPQVPCLERSCQVKGVWFPESGELFQPLIADPRQISFSAAWRFHDDVFKSRVAAISFGNNFPVFRWLDIGCWHWDLQIGIEGGVWAIFEMGTENTANDGDIAALLNSDYYVGVPLTGSWCNWSFRLRWYHISSHLGDEFMVINPDVKRLNPSFEAIDLILSYYLTPCLRFYGGGGVIYNSNHSFRQDPLYFQYGLELHLGGTRSLYHCLYWQPFFAVNVYNQQDVNWNFDATYLLGLEISKLSGLGRKVRIFAEYHDGFSFEGQFMKLRTNYLAARLMFGY